MIIILYLLITVILLAILHLMVHPVTLNCFCGQRGWWYKCEDTTQSSSPQCQNAQVAWKNIADDVNSIEEDIADMWKALPPLPKNKILPGGNVKIPRIEHKTYITSKVPEINLLSGDLVNWHCPFDPLAIVHQTEEAIEKEYNELKSVASQDWDDIKKNTSAWWQKTFG